MRKNKIVLQIAVSLVIAIILFHEQNVCDLSFLFCCDAHGPIKCVNSFYMCRQAGRQSEQNEQKVKKKERMHHCIVYGHSI